MTPPDYLQCPQYQTQEQKRVAAMEQFVTDLADLVKMVQADRTSDRAAVEKRSTPSSCRWTLTQR